jgi:hypothetical protein
MIHLEPHGTSAILPAFVIGYELPVPDCPQPQAPWIVTVDHQAGGLAMSYPSVLGAVLRLQANRDRGKEDLAHLIRGFQCMAEDPDIDTLRQTYPVFSRLVLTRGNDYTKDELWDLRNVLGSYIRVPSPRAGLEAFLRFAPCDPLDYFRGWKVLRCTLRTGNARRGSPYALPESEGYWVDDGNLTDLEMADDAVYDELSQQELVNLGAGPSQVRLPDVFFLWENSD